MSETVLNNPLLDYLEEMNRVESIDVAWEKTTAYMRRQGASHVGNILELEDSGLVHLNTSSPKVVEIYREYVYPDHDPKLAHCRKNVTPYFFGKEFWDLEPNLSKPRQWCDEEVADAGGRALVAFPVQVPMSEDWGHVSIAADCSRDEFLGFFKERGSALELGAITAFTRIYALVRNERAGRVGLTERECECLLWLARGQLGDRIAERMNVRPTTVAFHLANARRKLNARTSGQALIKAVQLGLIAP